MTTTPFAATTKHGTPNAYVNYGCRCAECRAANAARQADARRRRAATGSMRHGKVSTYDNYLCRCAKCYAAKSAENAAARAQRKANT
jgi:hypothetical protein